MIVEFLQIALGSVLIIATTFVAYFLFMLSKRRLIKNVPAIPNDSVFGCTKLLISHNGDNHLMHLDNANNLGPIVQYNLFGHHRFCVYDKKLAKDILKLVEDKVAAFNADGRNDVNELTT